MPHALIAGGGIAGIGAAVALTRAGWQVTVFEKAEALREVGAGLQLSPNATRVLAHWGLLDAVQAHAVAPEAAVIRDGQSGEEFFRLPLGAAAVRRWGAPYLQVHRADLLDTLVQAARAAGVTIHLAREVTALATRGDQASLVTADGAEQRADLALAALGIHGMDLEGIARRTKPRFTGETAWRATIPADAVPPGTLPPEATVWAGPGKHAVTYQLRGGRLINLVAACERRDWTAEGWRQPGDPDRMRARYKGWAAPVVSVMDAVEECFLWGLFDRPPMQSWVAGRTALIGDAAHPMLPFMAQGASQALEDAAALVRHLGAAKVPDALRAWQDERRPRAARVQTLARDNAARFHRRPGLARLLTRTPMRLASRISPGLAAWPVDWLYGHDAT